MAWLLSGQLNLHSRGSTFVCDNDGSLFYVNTERTSLIKLNNEGETKFGQFGHILDLCFDQRGFLFVSDGTTKTIQRISDEQIEYVSQEQAGNPSFVTVDQHGALYFVDKQQSSQLIKRISSHGEIETIGEFPLVNKIAATFNSKLMVLTDSGIAFINLADTQTTVKEIPTSKFLPDFYGRFILTKNANKIVQHSLTGNKSTIIAGKSYSMAVDLVCLLRLSLTCSIYTENDIVFSVQLRALSFSLESEKYFVIQLVVDQQGYYLFTHWGRNGEPGQNALRPQPSVETAKKEFEKK